MERNKDEDLAFSNTKLQRWLSAIDSALDRLHFLASAIRKASTKRQEPDLFNFASDEDRLFHSVAVSYVKWKYPNARPSLREHMADFIAARRRVLLQKHRHAKKLKRRRAPMPSPDPRPEQPLAPLVEKLAAKTPALRGVSRIPESAAGSRATQASKMDARVALQHISQRPTLSIRSSGSSQQGGGSMPAEYPDPPRIKHGEKHVQCPYCLEPLPAAELRKPTKDKYWR